MILEPGSIEQLASEGYLTLQVPEISICFNGSLPVQTNYPEDWFCYLRIARNNTHEPAVGKEEGFLYLTEKGYSANKQLLQKVFTIACNNGRDRTNGIGWPAFDKHAINHFIEVKANLQKRISNPKTTNKKLQELLKFVV